MGIFYSNRTLGPTLSLSYENYTAGADYTSNFALLDYTRTLFFSASASFPFQWTYSTLTPWFAVNVQQSNFYQAGPQGGLSNLTAVSPYIPSVEFVLYYSNAESSPLAISAEEGRSTTAGTRLYSDSGYQTWKALVIDQEYLKVTEHSVLVPEIKASWTTNTNPYAPANVVVEGETNTVINGLLPDSLNQITIRGYPLTVYYAKAVAVASLDYRFPIAQVFRGLGVWPAYLQNLYGIAFVEDSYFPDQEPGAAMLPSVGGGLRANTTAFIQVPLILSLEWHQGLQANAGGVGELLFQVGLGAIAF